MKTRKDVPKAIEEQVKEEYSHRCAICGGDRPQLHHMDEDPANNDPLNLLPLCPNCHLRDQHRPTTRIPLGKLRLFRVHKDPSILSAQFDPLYQRLTFLDSTDGLDASAIFKKSRELVQFIQDLQMGSFYSKRVGELLAPPPRITFIPTGGMIDFTQASPQPQQDEQYRKNVRGARDQVIALVVELLRYQSWLQKPKEIGRSG